MLLKFRHISCLIAITFIWVTIGAEESLQILVDEQKLC